MKKTIKDYAPIGISFKTIFGFIALQYSMILLNSISFFIGLHSALITQKECSIEMGKIAQIESFVSVVGNSFVVVPISFLACLLGLGVHNYAYHYKDSKSVYLMKRLPNKYEYFRRVIAIPIVTALGVLVLFFALFTIYYLIYITKSPADSVASGQLKLLFDVWFRGGKF